MREGRKEAEEARATRKIYTSGIVAQAAGRPWQKAAIDDEDGIVESSTRKQTVYFQIVSARHALQLIGSDCVALVGERVKGHCSRVVETE